MLEFVLRCLLVVFTLLFVLSLVMEWVESGWSPQRAYDRLLYQRLRQAGHSPEEALVLWAKFRERIEVP